MSDTPKKDSWDKVSILSKILFPIVAGVIAYFVKDTVDLALRRQEAEISSARGMEQQIAILQNPSNQEVADGAAIALAAYGKLAIPPLFFHLCSNNTESRRAAEEGLVVLSYTHQEEVCSRITTILYDRRRKYGWRIHASAISLLDKIGCVESLPVLLQFKSVIDGDTTKAKIRYCELTSDLDPRVDDVAEHVKSVIDSVECCIKSLSSRL